MFHIVLPVFGIMPFSLCIFLCFSHVCLLRRPVEAKPVQTQSISERDLGRARCLLWFGGQLWRQPQSTRVENIFLGFLFLSISDWCRSWTWAQAAHLQHPAGDRVILRYSLIDLEAHQIHSWSRMMDGCKGSCLHLPSPCHCDCLSFRVPDRAFRPRQSLLCSLSPDWDGVALPTTPSCDRPSWGPWLQGLR